MKQVKWSLIGVLSLSLLGLAGCSSSSDHGCEHWTYTGECGPANWGETYPDALGTEQSPINIVEEDAVPPGVGELEEITVQYGLANVEVLNNGHAVQADVVGSDHFITIGTKQYNLAQFHFHTQSENTIDNRFFELEMHLVHKAEDGKLAVIGVFFDQGIKNLDLMELLEKLPQLSKDPVALENQIDLNNLLPENLTAYRFAGSLTTPPCTEGVDWTVMNQALGLSIGQIDAFKAIFSGEHFPYGNRRPVQPINSRKVYRSSIDIN